MKDKFVTYQNAEGFLASGLGMLKITQPTYLLGGCITLDLSEDSILQ